MIVNCQECHAKFKFEEERYVGKRVSIRCSRCGVIFAVLGPPAPVALEGTSSVAEGAGQEALSPEFQEFLDRLTKELPQELMAEGMEEELLEKELAFRKTEARPRAAFWSDLFPMVLVILVAMVAIAFTYSFLSSANKRQVVVRGGVDLTDLTAYYGENKHAGLLFVIEGKVVNRFPKAKSFIKLKGQLFDKAGKVIKSKEVYAGNLLSRQELSDLPQDRIEATLATAAGHASANVNVAPRQAVPFTLVFFDLPKNIGEYSLQVIAAQDT